MNGRDLVVAALVDRFPDQGLRVGRHPAPLATFPAKHRAVGDALVQDVREGSQSAFHIDFSIGGVVFDSFTNYDTHLDANGRWERLTRDLVRLLEELFQDRLLMWRSTDSQKWGWRERGPAGHS